MSATSAEAKTGMPVTIGRFALHFLEMCVVMCMGGAVLNALVFGAIGVARPRFVAELPELAALIIGVDLAIAMAVYMAVRRHPVRHNAEMSLSSVVGAIPFAGAFWLGVLPRTGMDSWMLLYKDMCGPICAVMLIVMIARSDHYTGRHSPAGTAHAGH